MSPIEHVFCRPDFTCDCPLKITEPNFTDGLREIQRHGVALCANLLFAYADAMDVDFHIAAITELARVAPDEALSHTSHFT